MNILNKIKSKPLIIGMIHLLPLPGYKDNPGMNAVISHALKELESLQKGGIHAVLIENDMDQPHQVKPDPEIIVAMAKITESVVKNASIMVGVEVLLNDPKASLAISYLSGADFIRTDYFVDRMSREEYGGEMVINPRELMEYRKKIKAENISILTDIQVKYAKLLEKNKSIAKSTLQAIDEKSDGIVVSGNFTGEEPKLEDLIEAKNTAKEFPILVGSGFSSVNAKKILEYADGAIVGTSIKSDDVIDLNKVKELMQIVNAK
jgi:membrane complex biogenesis BtpA family protein